jgi:hypothetical protein
MVENFRIWKTRDIPAYPPMGYGFLWGTISPTRTPTPAKPVVLPRGFRYPCQSLIAGNPQDLVSRFNIILEFKANYCYDFGRLGNRLQSKYGQRSKMSLEECKSLDLYCLARFESDQRVEENIY